MKIVGYLDRFVGIIEEPMDVLSMFDVLTDPSQERHLANGLRNLLDFYEVQGLASKNWLDLVRKNVPKVSVGVDLSPRTG